MLKTITSQNASCLSMIKDQVGKTKQYEYIGRKGPGGMDYIVARIN